jgi:WD40-like Beta Propeller Repeat
VEGGAVIDLCAAPAGRGGSWGEDGSIIAALTAMGSLSRIPSAGGVPTPVSELAEGEATHRWPQIVSGGKAVLFTASASTVAGFDGANIEAMSLADHQRKTLQRGGTYGRYLPNGHLVYVNRGTLFAVPVDLEKLEVQGTPTPVLNDVGYSTQFGFAQFDFSRSGTLVYRNGGGASGLVTVQWLDGAGKKQPLLAKPGNYNRPRLSPDGQRLGLLVTDESGQSQDFWSYEWQRDTMTRLTFSGTGQNPIFVWTPDGRYIVFQAEGGISWTRADGAGQPQPLILSKNLQLPWSFAPDGKRLAYGETNPGTGVRDVWTVPVETGGAGLRAGKPELLLQTKFDQTEPSFSPDGRWLAYSSNESGSYQVYVRAFPDNGSRWQISNSGGMLPTWSRNGRDLFFRTEDSRMILVASYTVKGDVFVADKPRVWLETPLAGGGINQNYDLAPDGKRIAALMAADAPQGQQAQNHVIFLMNFFDEVRRRTATQTK